MGSSVLKGFGMSLYSIFYPFLTKKKINPKPDDKRYKTIFAPTD
jgi:hypothetical protein